MNGFRCVKSGGLPAASEASSLVLRSPQPSGCCVDLEAGELRLELGDARLLDCLDRLRLDLGVPDLQLLHRLTEHGRGAANDRGGGAAAGEERRREKLTHVGSFAHEGVDGLCRESSGASKGVSTYQA